MRLLVFFMSMLFVPASAQVPESEPVVWTALVEPETARPGETVEVVLFGEIVGDWRMYAIDSPIGRALDLRLEQNASLTPVGGVRQGTPEEGYDELVESAYTYFSGTAEVMQTLRVAPNAPGGSTPIQGVVHYMVCNDEICLPPMQERFAVSVDVRGSPVATLPEEPVIASDASTQDSVLVQFDTPRSAALAEPNASPFEPATPERGGLWGFLLLAIGAGLVALLTPCVFPMIPLTVSYFLHHAGDRRKAARMAGVYGLAIVGLFTLLGVVMALVVGAAGPQLIAANPWVNLFIGLVLVVFGFSLLGFFELRMPAAWANALNRQGDERGGYLGVMFMSLTLVLVSFSCTVPFVGGLLAAASQGGWARPLIGMVVFSSVFALPFVLFAAFPNALTRLPKSGSWMGALKGVLGFIEIAAALKFLSNADLVWGTGLLPRPLAIALMIVIFALAGLYLIGKLHLKGPDSDYGEVRPVPIGGLRLLTAMAFFGLAFYFVPGLLGAPLGGFDAFLPPRQATDVSLLAGFAERSDGVGKHAWHQDRATAFEEARRTGRPVLIDFTGYTCTNCRHMEATVLSRPEIAERIDRHFVPLQLWTDNAEDGPDLQRYQLELTGRIALPTYAIVAPDGQLVSQLSGVTSLERYAAFLDAGTVTFDESNDLAAR